MIRILLLTVFALCAVNVSQAQPGSGHGAEIPFEFDGHIFFHATLNGQPARLLYDPVNGLMLDRRYALLRPAWHRTWRSAGMRGPTFVGGAGSAQVEVTFVDSVELSLGNIQRQYLRVPVIPLDSMMGSAIAGVADGLLGTTVLSNYAVRFDFKARRAQLLNPATVDSTGWQSLPLTFLGARASVPVTIQLADGRQETLRTQVDWGMSPAFRVVTREVDARKLIRHATDSTPDFSGRGLGGGLESVEVSNVRISLGGIVSEPHSISLARERTGADANPPYDALMGLALLSDFDVIYDPTNARLLVRSQR